MDPHQEISNETLETILIRSEKASNNNNNNNNNKKIMEEEIKKKVGRGELVGGEAQKCPRCDSPNTKFCYYNNYSLSQPRYFCKSCRRYWTKGGTLRNVPVGGGCRRNKRSSSSSSSFSKNNKPLNNFHNDPLHNNPLITGMPSSSSSFGYNSSSIDLNLAFATLHKPSFAFGGDLSIYGNSSDVVFGNNNNNNGGIFGGQNGHFNNNSLCTYGFMSENGNERKQENVMNSSNMSSSSENHQSKVLWGFPWQMNGDSTTTNTGVGGPEIDSGRESWNGLASSPWHNGLLNTPLV